MVTMPSAIRVHDYPSFASFVRLARIETTQASVQKASVAAGFPATSWASLESGRFPRPSSTKLHAIARVLGIRPWPLAIIAGIKGSALSQIGGLLTDRLPQAPWWNLRGGNFVRLVRESEDRDYEAVIKRWQERWPAIPALGSVAAWRIIESEGVVPPLPAPPTAFQAAPTADLAKLDGAWWWALLDAVSGDATTAFYLVPAAAVVTGGAVIAIARKMDEKAAWDQLLDAYRQSYTKNPEAFDDAKYFAVAVRVAQAMRESAAIETSAQRLSRIAAVWESLSREQQEHVVAIVADLSKHQGM